MKNVAIIAFFHTEASLCLAKNIAEQGVSVDCYIITDMLHDKGSLPGVEFKEAFKRPGIVGLTEMSAPEIVLDSNGLPVNYYLLRIVSYSSRLIFLNKIIFNRALHTIRKKHYDAINIVGQWPWVKILHDGLRGENIIHTFHEVGDHQRNILTTPLIDAVIRDKSKVILPSFFTYSRFRSIPGSNRCLSTHIPMGCFYTLLLYQKEVEFHLNIDKSKLTFLFYGFIKPYKGLTILAKACKLIENKKDSFNLIIAGAGTDENLPYFESLLNCTVINRFLTDDEMMYLNKISDVVVLPYKSASQSGIVPTSFIFGNPIISTKVGALVETIKDGINGLLVEPEDAEGFAHAMIRMIEEKGLMKSLQEGAKSFGYGDEYDWSNIAKKTIDFYGK